jgi:hypothetical protein
MTGHFAIHLHFDLGDLCDKVSAEGVFALYILFDVIKCFRRCQFELNYQYLKRNGFEVFFMIKKENLNIQNK